MIHWGWLILAYMLGGTVGVFLMSLMTANSRGEQND